jgi:hypothetical protein
MLVLTMVLIGEDPFDPVKTAWSCLHAVVSARTIGTLRLKKDPTD